MSKVVEKAEEVKKDVVEMAEEAGKELQDAANDLANKKEKKPNGFIAGLKKYGPYALAFGLGWGLKTLKIMVTNQMADSSAVDAGNIVDMPVANADTKAV